MGGGIRYDPGGGGALPITQYSETFNRADEPFFLGNNWNFQPSDQCGNAPQSMAGGVNVGAGAATIGTSFGNLARSTFTPAFVDRQAITTGMLSRGQFSQFTVKGFLVGISCDVGPMVYNPNPNDANCYMLLLATATNLVNLQRSLGAATANIGPGLFAWTTGDIIRLEVTPGATANTVRSYKNGVLLSTIVDNSALRPQGGGHYGLAWFSSNVGTVSFGDYSGGLL